MDTLLLVVTGISVVVAIAASVIAWRVTGVERRRSAARIAALAAAAEVPALRQQMAQTAPWPHAALEDAGGLEDFRPTPVASDDPGQAQRPLAAGPATVPAGGMFAAPVPDSGSGGRQFGLLAAAAAVAVLVGGGSLVMLVSGRAPIAARTEVRVPLELVALSHARTDGQLAITGLVRNPATGAGVADLEAQVRIFDAAGIMIATRSATVPMASLEPGREASFVVTLGEAATAARYRVSFASRGTMLAHVDRRSNLPAAVTADAR